MLESCELRERGLEGWPINLLDGGSSLEMSCELADTVPEELRALLIHISRRPSCSIQLCIVNIGDVASPPSYCVRDYYTWFHAGTRYNISNDTPLHSNTLFGGYIPAALAADNLSAPCLLTRGKLNQSSGGGFKHSASKSPETAPRSKKGGRNNVSLTGVQ